MHGSLTLYVFPRCSSRPRRLLAWVTNTVKIICWVLKYLKSLDAIVPRSQFRAEILSINKHRWELSRITPLSNKQSIRFIHSRSHDATERHVKCYTPLFFAAVWQSLERCTTPENQISLPFVCTYVYRNRGLCSCCLINSNKFHSALLNTLRDGRRRPRGAGVWSTTCLWIMDKSKSVIKSIVVCRWRRRDSSTDHYCHTER